MVLIPRVSLWMFGLVVSASALAATTLAEEKWTGDWLFRATPEGSAPLRTSQKAWVDAKRKIVIVDGKVCLREGQLEMFACPRNTKEYESVVAVDASPGVIHGGLVRVGAKPGSPVSYDPYKPATGTVIDVIAAWVDKNGRRRAVPAQQWVMDAKTSKAMSHDWVFAGSRFVRDDEKGRVMYQADEGDFICVANFSTASLDIPVKSSKDNSALNFVAFTANIPPVDTKVRLILAPRLDKKKGGESADKAK
ncbi:MAG: YdjY domain-containing protein [Pirellulales bacterium]|nr:YdjY domain-containing protein [Pirellulales bacterium]